VGLTVSFIVSLHLGLYDTPSAWHLEGEAPSSFVRPRTNPGSPMHSSYLRSGDGSELTTPLIGCVSWTAYLALARHQLAFSWIGFGLHERVVCGG